MPRVFDSTNSPMDFCNGCFPDEQEAFEEYGDLGDGPDGRGNCFGHNCDHPDYDCENYICNKCRKLLESEDN